MSYLKQFLSIEIILTILVYIAIFYNIIELHNRVVKINETIDSINLDLEYIFQDFRYDEDRNVENKF